MAITISAIRVDDVQIEPNAEHGGYKIKTAQYSLIGSSGKVLAKQTIGGYQGMVLEPSPETKKALDVFTQSYMKDMQALLGLIE